MRNYFPLLFALIFSNTAYNQEIDYSFITHYEMKKLNENDWDTVGLLKQTFNNKGNLTKQIVSSFNMDKFPELSSSDSILHYSYQNQVDSVKYYNTNFENNPFIPSLRTVKVRENTENGFEERYIYIDAITKSRIHFRTELTKKNLEDQTVLFERLAIENNSIASNYRVEYRYTNLGAVDQIVYSDSNVNHGWRAFRKRQYHRNENERLDSTLTFSNPSGNGLTLFKVEECFYEEDVKSEEHHYEVRSFGRERTAIHVFDEYDEAGNLLHKTTYWPSIDWEIKEETYFEYDKRNRLISEEYAEYWSLEERKTKYVYEFQFQEVTGVNETYLEVNAIDLFPNPVTDVLTLKTEEGISSIQVYDLVGSLKMNVKAPLDNQINFGNLPSGNYLVRIVGSSSIHTEKVVKL